MGAPALYLRQANGTGAVGVFSDLTRAYLETWLVIRKEVARPEVPT